MHDDDKSRLVRRVLAGELSLHKIEGETKELGDAVEIRRAVIEALTGKALSRLGSAKMDLELVRNKNAENVIGAVDVPLGVAGPLKVKGLYAKGDFYVPLATTEGALIAGINRGVNAITKSGGANVRVLSDGMTRAPLFAFDSITDVMEFIDWLDSNKAEIKRIADSTTTHGKLKGFTHFVMGNTVWVRFNFSTGDAMGMNMVTIATEAVCDYVRSNFKGIRFSAVSGNMCSDKKESMINSLLGRGKSVVADAIISEAALSDVLCTDAQTVNEVNLRKNWLGSARAGSATKYNAHFANAIAAIFLSTGQDIAQVVGSSSGYTWTEVRGGDLYISVTLPSLEIGTVGGRNITSCAESRAIDHGCRWQQRFAGISGRLSSRR